VLPEKSPLCVCVPCSTAMGHPTAPDLAGVVASRCFAASAFVTDAWPSLLLLLLAPPWQMLCFLECLGRPPLRMLCRRGCLVWIHWRMLCRP
jgi:hypothetical protein